MSPQFSICVVGAGAVGGMMATKLSLSGHALTIIDIGEQLAAICENGIKLISADSTEHTARVRAVESGEDAGPQDLIILAVKAHTLEQVVAHIRPMLASHTTIMTVQNGIPWWYFERSGDVYEGVKLHTLDPSGRLSHEIDPKRIIGCVVYPAAEVVAPGVIRHREGDRFPLGELDGKETDRIRRLQDAFLASGFKSRILDDIRSEIWLKAWGTLAFNPISALSHATLAEICEYEDTRRLALEMMKEAQAVAEKLGVKFRHTAEHRLEGARAVGAHKTSMLQDVELGRSLEIEALVGAVLEMAELTKSSVPTIQAIYACTKLLNKTIVTSGKAIKSASVH